jgi:hypothetical protein
MRSAAGSHGEACSAAHAARVFVREHMGRPRVLLSALHRLRRKVTAKFFGYRRMSRNKSSQHGIGGDADDMRLRYHLVSLYALKPIPDDLLSLAHEIGTRLRNQQADGS